MLAILQIRKYFPETPEEEYMQLGFVGLGRMGQAMVPRLLAAGYPVTVWNRTPERAAPLLEYGATLVDSPAALAADTDITLSILTDDRAVEDVYTELLSGDISGKLFIEMSTIRPATIEKLAAALAAKGADLLDAPVSGTVGPAREGRLIALVGGEHTALERARPVLDTLCRRIEHLGPNGSGTMMKLVLNMPMAIYWQGLSEALAMGKQSGLDLAQMLDLIADSPAGIGALRAKIPAILENPAEVAFDVTGVRKDLLAMTATAHLHGVPAPAGSAALAVFAAATAADWGKRDLAQLIPYYLDLVEQSTR